MCYIEDEDVAGLWAEHYPKQKDRILSKALCLTLYYIITKRAETILRYGDWSGKLHHAIAYFGVPKDQFYEFAIENEAPCRIFNLDHVHFPTTCLD